MAHPNKLQDARVLVFGSTSGIGFATASLVLSQGAFVTITGSNQARIDATLDRLRNAYPSISPNRVNGHICDLSKAKTLEGDLTTLFDFATSNGANKLDHIAFTAGDSLPFPKLSELDAESIQNSSIVRSLGPILIAKLLATGKYMHVRSESSFTITGGVNTLKPTPGWFFIAASGAFSEGLSRGLAVDLAPIRVNLVAPGAIHTELLQGFVDKAGDVVLENFRKQTLTGTVGKPHDTAEAYVYLMRDYFMTGSRIDTNGGSLLK